MLPLPSDPGCDFWFPPLLPFFRFHNQTPRKIKAASAATPLIVPPMIAPVFFEPLLSPSVSGAEAALVDDEEASPELVDEAPSVSVLALADEVSEAL